LSSSDSYKFTKAERLCRTKLINYLFEQGNTFHYGIFKVVWSVSPIEIPSPAQVAFSVSKRSFRHAVSRNLAKRRMREAYRLNKSALYQHLITLRKQVVFVIILKGNEIPSFDIVEKSVKGVIEKLITLNKA
jgi:ribonuclease P protein component